MNIRNVTRKAQKSGQGIARKSDGLQPTVFIWSNLTKLILAIPKSNPDRAYSECKSTLENIIATDWYVL